MTFGDKVLGSGAFGIAQIGKYKDGEYGEYREVCLKICRLDIDDSMKTSKEIRKLTVDIYREAINMKGLDHKNVLNIIGVSLDKDNMPIIILPFMTNGSIKDFLRNVKKILAFGGVSM